MKKISDIIPKSDAYKSLEKRKKETSIVENVKSIKTLAEEIYEVRSKNTSNQYGLKYEKMITYKILICGNHN